MTKTEQFLLTATQEEKDRYFMQFALEEAEQAGLAGDWPIGCVIVCDNKIIGRGRNRSYSRKDRTSHAEIEALRNTSVLLLQKGPQSTVYVTYSPCPMCFGGLLLNHIGRLVCGPDFDLSGSVHMAPHLPTRFHEDKYRMEVVSDFMVEECERVIKKSPFFAERLLKRKKEVDQSSTEQ